MPQTHDIGLDIHKESPAIGYALGGPGEGAIDHEPCGGCRLMSSPTPSIRQAYQLQRWGTAEMGLLERRERKTLPIVAISDLLFSLIFNES